MYLNLNHGETKVSSFFTSNKTPAKQNSEVLLKGGDKENKNVSNLIKPGTGNVFDVSKTLTNSKASTHSTACKTNSNMFNKTPTQIISVADEEDDNDFVLTKKRPLEPSSKPSCANEAKKAKIV